MADTASIAGEVLDALATRTLVSPFTERVEGWDSDAAYRVTTALRGLRVERGERVIGRKIGFTNRNIWEEYEVYEPIWGDVYDTTQRDVTPGSEARLSHLPQPRLEPEIVIGLARDLRPGMTVDEIEARIGWIAHSFEIVQSIYPDWKFRVADCIADGGLHGALFVGPRLKLEPAQREGLAAKLAGIQIELFCNGTPVDTGIGSNVLDGPVHALKYLADGLTGDADRPFLRAGEFISTGTITRAFPAATGERWSTRVTGIDLPGMDITFT